MTFHKLGMSSSQLTFIFFRGVETTNQIGKSSAVMALNNYKWAYENI
jgi:hypothetical protein